MTPEFGIVIGWLLILFGVCGLYALILSKNRRRYHPNRVWLVMLIGGALVWCGPAGMEWSGVDTNSVHNALVGLVAFAPIGIWQAIEYVRRSERNGH